MPREDVPEQLVEIGAERIDDLLVQLGVVPDYAPEHDSIETVKRILAGAVLSAVSEAGWELRRADDPVGSLHSDRAEVREACAQAEALAEALDFYSDRDAWLHQWVDGGACARSALRAYRSSQESS